MFENFKEPFLGVLGQIATCRRVRTGQGTLDQFVFVAGWDVRGVRIANGLFEVCCDMSVGNTRVAMDTQGVLSRCILT